ncbi:Putative ABC transporter ATP-binding protein in rpoN region [Pseudorhizobium banfieldiae]|uniref:Putative ABC transporter ATP-binding protein in rpoN region n=1 Tax=Pseudorhizobium banfieldiae TaxID=1125847 RepID=L0NDC0_9HYPH|nr:LPS export ABC transporter ATP-binding protein [Pseudorhizobium banfieldiae]CAD6601862.1 LPS export ABC transporter ATP-binding protein [arsenite-oxidising bacterium NT-25]CCF18302.1 Putative ABC transporter ATP-binding protein in rpoN region [Pseudorhizobium banfieldiae]
MTALTAERLHMRYSHQSVVNDISMTIHGGEFVGLFGPSGSGKSTIFKMIIGASRPTAGRVLLDGRDLTDVPIDARARLGLGYVPQNPQLFSSLTVEQNIAIAVEANEADRGRRETSVDSLCRMFDLGPLRYTRVAALSGGERRRCEIAFALAVRPRFLLLDEPLTGLDPIASDEILHMLTTFVSQGIGILLTEHKVRSALFVVDRSYVVNRGNVIAEGTAQKIIENESVRRSFLGTDFPL